MPTNRSVKSLYSWKPFDTRPVGIPKIQWEEDVKADIKNMKVPNWKITVQDRTKWKGVTEKAKTLRGLQRQNRRIIWTKVASRTVHE
jgi:hypothetical protein